MSESFIVALRCFLIVGSVLLLLNLISCAAAPEIIRPKGLENPIVQKLRNDANSPIPVTPSYSWLWWYAPIAIISLLWTIKYLFLRKCIEQDIDIVPEAKNAMNKSKQNRFKAKAK